jgi:Domain of unknown function (DUF6265)
MRLKLYLLAVPALLCFPLTAEPAAAASCALADLQLMAGTWRDNEEANVLTEERWVVGPGGRMIGSSWRLHSDTDGGVLESMSIVMENGAPTMRIRHFDSTLAHAREEKDAPMVFVALKCGDDSVVLDGTGPQTGEHFTYARDGDSLTFVGNFIHDGKPVRAEAHFDKWPEETPTKR